MTQVVEALTGEDIAAVVRVEIALARATRLVAELTAAGRRAAMPAVANAVARLQRAADSLAPGSAPPVEQEGTEARQMPRAAKSRRGRDEGVGLPSSRRAKGSRGVL